MTAEEHNQTLSTLYFVYGGIHGLTLMALLLLVVAVRAAVDGSTTFASAWLFGGVLLFLFLSVFVAVLPVVVGFGFKRRAGWVKPTATALAIVSMINVPIGTALGVYTIKFLRSSGGMEIYGGASSSTSEADLNEAMKGAEPLMNWADRFKS